MPDLRVVVLEVTGPELRALLCRVDRPGELVREVARPRSDDLSVDAAAVLAGLEAGDLAPVLLAVAVSVGPDVAAADVEPLRTAFGAELPDGWGLPAPLTVVWGGAATWAAQGAAVPDRPAVAAAVVAAARAVGAHAHLPTGDDDGAPGT